MDWKATLLLSFVLVGRVEGAGTFDSPSYIAAFVIVGWVILTAIGGGIFACYIKKRNAKRAQNAVEASSGSKDLAEDTNFVNLVEGGNSTIARSSLAKSSSKSQRSSRRAAIDDDAVVVELQKDTKNGRPSKSNPAVTSTTTKKDPETNSAFEDASEQGASRQKYSSNDNAQAYGSNRSGGSRRRSIDFDQEFDEDDDSKRDNLLYSSHNKKDYSTRRTSSRNPSVPPPNATPEAQDDDFAFANEDNYAVTGGGYDHHQYASNDSAGKYSPAPRSSKSAMKGSQPRMVSSRDNHHRGYESATSASDYPSTQQGGLAAAMRAVVSPENTPASGAAPSPQSMGGIINPFFDDLPLGIPSQMPFSSQPTTLGKMSPSASQHRRGAGTNTSSPVQTPPMISPATLGKEVTGGAAGYRQKTLPPSTLVSPLTSPAPLPMRHSSTPQSSPVLAGKMGSGGLKMKSSPDSDSLSTPTSTSNNANVSFPPLPPASAGLVDSRYASQTTNASNYASIEAPPRSILRSDGPSAAPSARQSMSKQVGLASGGGTSSMNPRESSRGVQFDNGSNRKMEFSKDQPTASISKKQQQQQQKK